MAHLEHIGAKVFSQPLREPGFHGSLCVSGQQHAHATILGHDHHRSGVRVRRVGDLRRIRRQYREPYTIDIDWRADTRGPPGNRTLPRRFQSAFVNGTRLEVAAVQDKRDWKPAQHGRRAANVIGVGM